MPVFKECEICREMFRTKKSHFDRRKTCGKECDAKRRKTLYVGERNPNFGNRGEKCYAWKGGRRIHQGYVELLMHEHPMSNKDGCVREHRLIMSDHLGRLLEPHEDVHHIDGNKLNNDITNLVVLTRSQHTSIHNKEKEIVRDALGRIKSVKIRERK
jgi:hypothetical protein